MPDIQYREILFFTVKNTTLTLLEQECEEPKQIPEGIVCENARWI